MQLLDPITSRDFTAGRITKAAVSPALVPANSVANSINVDFSEIIGSGIVRKGKKTIVQLVGNSTDGQMFTNTVNGDELAIFDVNDQAQGFTPSTDAQTHPLAIKLQLYRLGTASGALILRLQNTTANLPNGSNVVPAISIDVSALTTSTAGQVITVPLPPGVLLTVGVMYAITLAYASGDGTHKIFWRRNAAGVLINSQASSSTDSGTTWSTTAGVFYFDELILDTANAYSKMPLGLLGFIMTLLARGVVAYQNPLFSAGTVFYYDNGTDKWLLSDLTNLNQTAKVRFAVLNGRVFEANGSEAMKSSGDFGATWTTADCITTDSVIPALLIVSKNRMLASGFSTFPSRVYFSSLVDPNSSPFITWATDPSTGDWIDINPDDGGRVTGFALTSSMVLVFKTTGMYRLNTIARSVDAENIFNQGAVSQECITNCLGLTYFYSGQGIYQTDGTFPQHISRVGVQDFVDGIQDPSTVTAGNDGFNVYFSLGTVNLTIGPEDFRTYTKVVLKFSPRDQNWQVFVYDQILGQMTLFGIYGPNKTINMITAQWNGALATVNSGTGDDTTPVSYSMESQEQEFGNRAHTKQISDHIVAYSKFGGEGMFSVKSDDGNFDSANMRLNERVNITDNVNFTGHFFTFRWQGETALSRPIFEGYHLPKVTDLGVVENGPNV